MNQRVLALLEGREAGAFAKDLRRWTTLRELDKDKQKVVADCIRYPPSARNKEAPHE